MLINNNFQLKEFKKNSTKCNVRNKNLFLNIHNMKQFL